MVIIRTVSNNYEGVHRMNIYNNAVFMLSLQKAAYWDFGLRCMLGYVWCYVLLILLPNISWARKNLQIHYCTFVWYEIEYKAKWLPLVTVADRMSLLTSLIMVIEGWCDNICYEGVGGQWHHQISTATFLYINWNISFKINLLTNLLTK